MARGKKKDIRPWQWKKGKPPKGKAGVRSMARVYREMLNEPASCVPAVAERAKELNLDPDTTTIAGVLSASQLADAVEGKHFAAKDIADRVDNYLHRGLTRAQLAVIAERIVEIISQEVRDPQIRSNIGERILALVKELDNVE